MEWVEKRDGDYLVSRKGKILGRVFHGSGSAHVAEAIYAGGGNHKQGLGDYISVSHARDAVEDHIRGVGLADAADPA